jgi:vesicle transport protein SEC22
MKPYQYMSFETFITKTKRVYADSRAKDGLHDVNNQLNDVKNIMNKNINDLLNRGENLNNLQDLSSSLREQSVKYKKYAKKINWDLLIKQYAPVAVVALVFLLLIYRWFF